MSSHVERPHGRIISKPQVATVRPSVCAPVLPRARSSVYVPILPRVRPSVCAPLLCRPRSPYLSPQEYSRLPPISLAKLPKDLLGLLPPDMADKNAGMTKSVLHRVCMYYVYCYTSQRI